MKNELTFLTGAPANAGGPEAADATPSMREYPATLAQRRFWALDRLEPGNSALNVAVRWRIEGDLPAALVERAFVQIIERHEPLRTYFVEVDGEPVQVVQPETPFRVASIDLTTRPEAEALAECDRIAGLEASAPFNLAIAPLIRVTHVRIRPNLAIVLVTVHHAVSDGWSVGVLAREMGVICAALQAGRRPELPDLPIAYGDYAAWQREVLSEDALAPEIEYWSRALDGLEYFEVPTDFPRRAAQGSALSIQSLLLDKALTDRLADVARREGCTLFMLIYAAVATVLHRYTGASDIAMITQVAGRDHVETENLVGVFINTLVLRLDLSGDPTFVACLARARAVVMQALENEAMPYEKVVELQRASRRPGQGALSSVNIVFQRSFVEDADYGTFRLVDLPASLAATLYDVNFSMVERPEGWRFSCGYRTDLFEPDTIGRMLGHVRTLLDGVAADAARPLSEFPLLSEAERRTMLVEWNATEAEYPNDKGVHEVFEAQAARTPDAIAATHGDEQRSYRDLNASANRLAHHLRALGVRPGDRVAIGLERSVALVLAELAILKCGAAYVPLDLNAPAERQAFIIEDCQARVLLTTSGWGAPEAAGLMRVDVERLDLAGCDPADRAAPVDGGALAYVMYTSGSTGRPKGVMTPHRAIARLAVNNGYADFESADRVAFAANPAFDATTMEVWGALLNGARIVVIDNATLLDAGLFRRELEQRRVTIMFLTSGIFHQYADILAGAFSRLRYLLTGGDVLDPGVIARLLQKSPPKHLLAAYGPTETTTYATTCELNSLPARSSSVPIGRPIANTRIYILDRHGQPVPIGATGEIHIGGPGVALGYLNRPELTAERFVVSPFMAGDRLYKTGDLGRYRSDGIIEFVGRNDFQVKIRGFRIELGEIEARLAQQPGVREVVALAREDAPGDKRLAAYYTVVPEAPAPSAEALRAALSASLPGYMVPAAFVRMDAMPLTPNGKIDRKALPRPGPRQEAKVGESRPADQLELRLAQIWRDVLGVERVEPTSDFFELGGHSLIAIRLLAQVEAAFGRRIATQTLFEARTFAALVNQLRSRPSREFDFRQVVRLGSRSARRTVFAIHNTGIFLTLSQRLDADLSITALQLFDPLIPMDEAPASFEDVAGRYVRLIRKIQPKGPYALMGWCNGGALAFETARQLEGEGESVSRVFAVDTWIPGYFRRMGRVRAALTEYSYRLQLVQRDWAAFRAGRKPFKAFVADRAIVRRLLGRGEPVEETAEEPAYAAAWAYDQRLVRYITGLRDNYQPKPIRGRLTVLRSACEPVGRLLDPKMGWDGMAGGVDLVVVPGDHDTVFREPGVSDMARHIEAALRVDGRAG